MTADIIHPFILFIIFLLYKYQFRFQAKHSTLQAVSTPISKFTKCLDPECHNGNWDFTQYKKKHFIRYIILFLLKTTHIWHKAHDNSIYYRFKTYLSVYSQYVICHVTFGVPQGSIFRHLFFLAYVNNIFIADDTSILISDNNYSDLMQHLNNDQY